MAKPEITWVIVGPDPHLATCQRCGATIPKPEFPMALSQFCAELNAACEQHRECNGGSVFGGTAYWRLGVVDDADNYSDRRIALSTYGGGRDIIVPNFNNLTDESWLQISASAADKLLAAVNSTQFDSVLES